ncbi:MAG: flagellar M-ring protein FliF C-terminal domain-containing protein, partial [Rhodanobacter sp.]
DPDSPSAIGDTRLRMATRIENTYAQRIEQLLTPLVGQGRVRAQVYADLDFSRTEKATETFGHEHPALRSEQTSSEQNGGAAAGGIPGALSNQPPSLVAQRTASTTTANANGSNERSSSATRNFELDRTISHVSDPAGRLARLTVAVVLDNKLVAAVAGDDKDNKDGKPPAATSVAFTEQELQHLTELTKNAVGFDAQRGDSVSVVNQLFQREPAPGNLPETPLWQRPGVMDLIKQGLGILLALLVGFGLLRPLLKGLLRSPSPQQALPAPMPKISVRVADDDDEPEKDSVRLSGSPTLAYEQRVGAARRMVTENPKQVAQVVKNWVSEDGS